MRLKYGDRVTVVVSRDRERTALVVRDNGPRVNVLFDGQRHSVTYPRSAIIPAVFR